MVSGRNSSFIVLLNPQMYFLGDLWWLLALRAPEEKWEWMQCSFKCIRVMYLFRFTTYVFFHTLKVVRSGRVMGLGSLHV